MMYCCYELHPQKGGEECGLGEGGREGNGKLTSDTPLGVICFRDSTDKKEGGITMNACLEERASIRVLRVEEHKGMWWEPLQCLG